jgi:hypothetical protein
VGLWRPKGTRWGTMRLTTTGRRTGRARSVILGYFEDGPNLVTLAMNGWADGEPGLVAEPAGPPRCDGRPPRRPARRHRAGGPGRRAVTAVGPLA